ncbi:hypothetical protein B7P43_G08569 [Cryptotermes secundus]|uniref:Uncharacterized protein n=1 Tax=Cryptotermes secundus TaxID=105785 RepID=A0A2J7R4Z7_9NEOP|nr:hypothetical protein B7P43_G08569 [Cryptotermes secundus]
MNHHVGQTADKNMAAGYVQKVLLFKFGSPLPANIVRAVHMLGHYISTRYILTLAGIPNILSTDCRVGSDTYEIRFAEDAKLRFNAPPAGTHRLAICFEAARHVSKDQYAHFCPELSDFTVLPGWRASVMADPAMLVHST